jgi:DNA ligase D-like protein (predicted 3'-phosphoesterase)
MTPLHFVVQEHQARTLHYDFRLEMGGVLRSWAIPKGLPIEPGIKRLAVQTEDHDLSFLNFEGSIPEGSYGAGHIEVWDTGTYELEEVSDDKIVFVLRGKKLNGRYSLIKFKKEKEWLIFMSK